MNYKNISGILIIEKDSGIPLLFQKLDPRLFDVDPTLVAGFLSALQAFSSTVISRGTSSFEVNYGRRTMVLATGERALLAAFSDRATPEVGTIISELLREFEEMYFRPEDVKGCYDRKNMEHIENFRQVIINRVGIWDLSDNWVPEFVSDKDKVELEEPLRSLINGKNNIAKIVALADLPPEEITHKIVSLWGVGKIVFRNLLEPYDILIPTQQVFKYVQSGTAERKELRAYSPELVDLLPEILQHLDGKTTVETLMMNFTHRVYNLLDYLFEKGAVEVLGPEKKRILLAKELLELGIEIAMKEYKQEEVIHAMRRAIRETEKPEIASELQVSQDSVRIDYGFKLYEGMTPEQIMDIHSSWLGLIRRFIRNLPEKKRVKFVEKFTENVRDEWIASFSDEDMDGLEELSFFLEEILTFS